MLTVIPYEEKYVEELVPLIHDLGYPAETETLKQRIRNVHKQTEHETFILLCENRVVGMMGLRSYYDYEEDEQLGEIILLVVKSNYQNKGLGLHLLNFAETHFKAKGIEHIKLNSGIKREREHAHYFYEKHNFIKNGYRFFKNIGK